MCVEQQVRNHLDAVHARRLQKMVGSRNIGVHDYQALQLPIVAPVITKHLGDFTAYSQALLLKNASLRDRSRRH